ncbi:hypothetical protein IDH32_01040 [Pelagibacterales bacterium SAG-MED01]|nr:hypothetical protein [Pelagibacterales bacterium SAG-MED01]
MYKNKKITLFAFASQDLYRSANRLKEQAQSSNYYDEIKVLSPKNFDDEMVKKFDLIKDVGKKRGYGYWFWKPIFLMKIMKEVNFGDIIHYIDVGCHIQNKNSKFYEYLDLLIKSENFILPFQYHLDNTEFPKDILFSKREEFKYTKADLLDNFEFLNNKNITHSPQFWAGSFFIKKQEETENFIREWIEVFDKKFNLIDDSDSVLSNLKGFINNRHDQSVFSLLCKKYSIKSLSAYECDWGEKNNKRTWDHNFDNPILAKRDLEYNIFRRFINRQIRTFNRYKNKYFKN